MLGDVLDKLDAFRRREGPVWAMLRRFYENADHPEIARRLAEHPESAFVLLEAVPIVRSLFGPSATLALGLPVFWKDEPEVLVEVRCPDLAVDDAMGRVERLWEAIDALGHERAQRLHFDAR